MSNRRESLPVMMLNPYKSNSTAPPDSSTSDDRRRHRFAGMWLIAAGVVNFAAINMLSTARSVETFDYTPTTLVILGLLVAMRIRVAFTLTRLLGSLTVIGFVFIAILLLSGFYATGGVNYGSTEITDPPWWMVVLLMAVIGVSILPPWWVLQREYAERPRMPASDE